VGVIPAPVPNVGAKAFGTLARRSGCQPLYCTGS
jgi:hypothetical protein